jgi:MATE family multidrug resistance protein
MKQFIPGTCCQISLMLSEVVNLLFIGQMNDPNILAGVGMGNCIQNMCGYSVVVGLNGALETLVSQAYGAKNYDQCGVYLNRGRIVLLITFTLVFIILSHTEVILVAIN